MVYCYKLEHRYQNITRLIGQTYKKFMNDVRIEIFL